ncbi:MAG: 4Fe-4S dicluster domain-containing protein [Candidatus Krumholzibacteriota bacterium]|nr:4Fe-4S dicluster domain-containing protein [Candidatus Krumholzibacteriota bacterium]
MIRIKKENISGFIEGLMSDYVLFAPVKDGETVSFRKIESADSIAEDYMNTDKSPKDIFFPPAEVLFSFDSGEITKNECSEKPFAVWGLRGCDVKSLTLLNMVFGTARQNPEDEMFQDPYWKEKYDNALIIQTACNDPRSTCFCNWFGGSPHDGEKADILVIYIGDAYLLDPKSDKGRKYLETVKNTEPAAKKDIKEAERLRAEADSSLSAVFELDGIVGRMSGLFNSGVWEEIGAKCVNCGACAFICPTCHCFDVQDEGKGKKGKRIRIWDTCMFPVFTAEASGHNPRELSKDRLRQRFMHKYSYFMENYGEHLCTGCGRCVVVCPVNLDIREVAKKVMSYQS